jgi:hypothetical protein
MSSIIKHRKKVGNKPETRHSSLDFSIYVMERGKKLILDKYRFQPLDFKNRLLFEGIFIEQ